MTFKEIKAEARGFLKGQWGKISAMLLVYLLSSYAAMIIFMLLGTLAGISMESLQQSPIYFVSVLIAYLFQCMLMLGYTTIMLKVASGRRWEIKDLFSNVRYTLKVFGMLILMTVYILLWSCLFIIPGIVKAISYSMSLYILAEDPTKGIRQCITESKEMMKGNKRRLFGLLFSFLGWALLAFLGYYIVGFAGLFGVSALGDVAGVMALILEVTVLCIVMFVFEFFFMIYVETSRTVFYYDISGIKQNGDLTEEQIKNQIELSDVWDNDIE